VSRATNRIVNLIAILVAAGEHEAAERRAEHVKRGAYSRRDRAERVAVMTAAGVEC
jgi:hypothetical protein